MILGPLVCGRAVHHGAGCLIFAQMMAVYRGAGPLLLIISFVLRFAKVAYTSALMSTVLLERLKRLELLERLDR